MQFFGVLSERFAHEREQQDERKEREPAHCSYSPLPQEPQDSTKRRAARSDPAVHWALRFALVNKARRSRAMHSTATIRRASATARRRDVVAWLARRGAMRRPGVPAGES